MLQVARLQRRLVRKLCGLPANSEVALPWLQRTVWPGLPDEWTERFWRLDSGRRQTCLNDIAALLPEEKECILEVLREQWGFLSPRQSPGSVMKIRWVDEHYPVLAQLRKLLEDFYDPWFYDGDGRGGYPLPGGRFHKDHFISGFAREGELRVCPYCDRDMRGEISLDHYYPKSLFPFLSCHPDNLIPCCHRCNKLKGDAPPCDWHPPDQLPCADRRRWFHPRLRPARRYLKLRLLEAGNRQLQAVLTARKPKNRRRMAHYDKQFHVTECWTQLIAGEIRVWQDTAVSDFARRNPPTTRSITEWIRDNVRRYHVQRDGFAILNRQLGRYLAASRMHLNDFAAACAKARTARKIPA